MGFLMNPKCPSCGVVCEMVPLGFKDKKWMCPKCREIYDTLK